MPDEQREGLQEELIDIILRVLKRNSQLHYYQGYHDIVVTFLLVVKERLATALVEKLSTHHLRYFYSLFNIFTVYYTICLHLVVVNPKVKCITTIQGLVALLKFRNLYSPSGKYKCHNICRLYFILYLFPVISWILPWTTQNTF